MVRLHNRVSRTEDHPAKLPELPKSLCAESFNNLLGLNMFPDWTLGRWGEATKDGFGTSGGETRGLCWSLAHRRAVWANVDPRPVLAARRDGEGLGSMWARDSGHPAPSGNPLPDGGRSSMWGAERENVFVLKSQCFGEV